MLKFTRVVMLLFATGALAGNPSKQLAHKSAPAATSAQTAAACVTLPVSYKCPAWVSTFDGEGHGGDTPGDNFLNSRVMATSPDSKLVFVGGATTNVDQGTDYLVLAYDTATGVQKWSFQYPGSVAGTYAVIYAITVSPNNDRVYVTGTSDQQLGLTTVALSATTGAQLWTAVQRFYDGPPDIAVSADGTRVFVCGFAGYRDPDGEIYAKAITIAYDAATGQKLWLQLDTGNPGFNTMARKIVANPDGSRVYVSAGVLNLDGYTIDSVLLVYDSATGNLLKESHHPMFGLLPAGIAVSPDGSHVFVTHQNIDALNNALTIAFDPSGNEAWAVKFLGVCSNLSCSARPWYFGPIAVSPDSHTVFLANLFVGELDSGFATVAYDTDTGAQKWVARFDSNLGSSNGPVIIPKPDGSEVYVAGITLAGAATIAYDSATGTQKWESIYPRGFPNSIAVTSDGSKVFTAGNISGALTHPPTTDPADVFVVGYDTATAPLPPSGLRITDVISRKTHGDARTFDIHFPNTGQAGIECRSGGTNGDHSVIFTLSSPLAAVGGASVDCGSISSSTIGPGQNQYTVNLTGAGVCNGRYVFVTLQDVVATDGNISATVLSSPIGLLVGDTNGDASVNSADISETKSQSGTTLTNANFREDLNTDGFLNSGDIGLVKSKSGTALPSQYTKSQSK